MLKFIIGRSNLTSNMAGDLSARWSYKHNKESSSWRFDVNLVKQHKQMLLTEQPNLGDEQSGAKVYLFIILVKIFLIQLVRQG